MPVSKKQDITTFINLFRRLNVTKLKLFQHFPLIASIQFAKSGNQYFQIQSRVGWMTS